MSKTQKTEAKLDALYPRHKDLLKASAGVPVLTIDTKEVLGVAAGRYTVQQHFKGLGIYFDDEFICGESTGWAKSVAVRMAQVLAYHDPEGKDAEFAEEVLGMRYAYKPKDILDAHLAADDLRAAFDKVSGKTADMPLNFKSYTAIPITSVKELVQRMGPQTYQGSESNRITLSYILVKGGLASASNGHTLYQAPTTLEDGIYHGQTGSREDSGDIAYPDLDQILPRVDRDDQVIVHGPSLHEIARHILKLRSCGDGGYKALPAMGLRVKRNKVYAITEHKDLGAFEGVVGVADYASSPREVWFNCRYIIQVMAKSKKSITVQIGASLSPSIFFPDNGEMRIVMPMRY